MSAPVMDPAHIFRLVSRELHDWEAIGLRVEAAVADLVALRDEKPRAELSASLQELDLLVQSIRDVATFTAVLGTHPKLDQAALAEALSALRLQRVRATLSGRTDHEDEIERETMF